MAWGGADPSELHPQLPLAGATSLVKAFGKCQVGPGTGRMRPLTMKHSAADQRTHGPRDPAEAGCPWV